MTELLSPPSQPTLGWPPDFAAATRARVILARHLTDTPGGWRAAREVYARDPLAFIRDWGTTFDPRLQGPRTIPLLPFQRQQDFLAWLTERYNAREDGAVEKARDMGVTWLCVAWSVWAWTFKAGIKIAFGSRKEDLVDRLGDPDSIFEKARIMLRWTPAPLLPRGFKETEHAGFLKLVNPANGSTITGEAGDNIGRGGRSSIYFLDEAAHIPRPQKVDAALDDNSDCKIYVSTHNGTGTTFYRKIRSGKIAVFGFKWHHHPGKTQEWYDREKAKRDPVNFAQEVDCDPEASLENVCCPSPWARAARDLGKLGLCRPSGKRIAGLDIGGGSALSVFIVRQGPIVETPRSWNDPDVINTGTFAADLMKAGAAEYLNFDVYGIGGGVAATLRRIPEVRALGVNTGDRPTDTRWEEGQTAKEKFLNLKAELWWTLRDRLYKSWQHLAYLKGEGGREHPLDELICLPDNEALLSELSTVRWFTTPTGKIYIETKEELSKRGIKSPDHADALVLTFAPTLQDVKVVSLQGFY